MKKQLELTVMLLVMVFGTLGLSRMQLFPLASATYVEGSIMQDTVWTLVNSPYVVSNDVVVYPNATLTIEPGTEVRFAANFSLTVNGKLVANGTQDKSVKFTSSKVEPEKGDWGMIRLLGSGSSSLVHCVIEFGTNGTLVKAGSVVIHESLVQFNSEIGIAIEGGAVDVEGNDVVNNTICGILIAGCDEANVRDNNVSLNTDGIILAGHLTSIVNVDHNKVLSNSGNGISLESDAYDNTVILNNTVSSNLNGFQISTDASTFITGNYVSNNTVGMLYSTGTGHEVHFNDVWDNEIGMDATSGARVNATHNYWGDRSGPYHESLNPYGEGNAVGGNGVNLDFIFHLTAPIDYANEPPMAALWSDKVSVASDNEVTFIGAESFDDGRVDQYFFDFGDGNNSGWTTLSVVNHTYHAPPYTDYLATLVVIDDFGALSENAANATITVPNLTPLAVTATLSNETVNYTEDVLITVYVSNETGPAENANVTLSVVGGGSFSLASGSTNSDGYFTSVFTSPNVTQVTDVRIIASASTLGYADGSNHQYVRVLPPLIVDVSAEEYSVKSEATTRITVKVSLGFRWPIQNALVIISCGSGTISPVDDSVTDETGAAFFTFQAPQTLNQMNVAILAIALREGYAQGQAQTSVTVEPRLLSVTVNAFPPIVLSEGASSIVVQVTSDAIRIPAVIVAALTDAGELSALANETDASGMVSFAFRAPQVTVREGLTANITLTAAKPGYVGAEVQTTIAVVAKTLIVDVTSTTNETVSEGEVNMTVHVTSQLELSPVQDANVTFTSEAGGSFVPIFGLTDSYGNVTFRFIAPQVAEQFLMSITAQASKVGYITEEKVFGIYMSPGTLSLNVTALSYVIGSNETTVITVHATCNETSVANVSVVMSADYGSFVNATLLTGLDGRAEFVYHAPITDIQLPVKAIVNASKFGYVNADDHTDLTVTPAAAPEAGGGLSLMTILMILVPIVIAIVVAVLLKLRIITIASEEEE